MADDSYERKYGFLDGLRGLAAILVVQRHAASTFGGVPFESSYLAVDFFFVLSGFVIAHAYGVRLLRGMTIGEFGARRLLRLYPMYLLGLLLVAACYSLLGAGFINSTLFLSLFFVPNIWTVQVFLLPPAWSLFCEWVAYFLYATVVRATASPIVFLALAAFGLVGVVICVTLYGTLDVGFRANDVWGGLARVMFGFFSGVLAYRYRDKVGPVPISIALAIAGSLAMLLILKVPPALRPYYDVVVVAAAPGMVLAGSAVSLPHKLRQICAILGDLSYPLYVLHIPAALMVSYIVTTLYHRPDGAMMNTLIWTFVVGASTMSLVIDRFVDRPARSRLARLGKRRLVQPAA